MQPTERLIVALDVPTLPQAEALVRALTPEVKIFKIGKELFTSAGPEAVRMVRRHGGKVFLDLKFHDIPNTVAGACRSALAHGVFMLNVHALGGRAMLEKAAQAVREARAPEKPILIGVTVLTSMNAADLSEVGIPATPEKQVETLSVLCERAGLDGVVASAAEISIIRRATAKSFVIVTPGVRPEWASHGDQKRVMTPFEAIQKGADYIVVGRPITQHEKPKEAARKVLEEIKTP